MKNIKQLILYLIIAITTLPVMAQRQKPVKTRVMTFNIRLENKNDGINNWEMRYQKVGEFILKQKVDIIGLQEVKQIQLEDLKKTMPDYDCVGVARDDGKQKGEYNPVFYNKKKFNLVNHGTFWLSETPLQPSRGWDAACNRIATWAILQDKETMKNIVFVNTHLDHVGKKARANSASLIKERLGRMLNELPLVVTGDFNVDDTDPVYNKVLTGIFPLNDTWKKAPTSKGPAYTFHDFGKISPQQAKKIDFIFTSPKIKIKKATIIDTTLGDGLYLSDHNAHSADIIF